MSDGTDKDNAYLDRLLQRAQELSLDPEVYCLTQHIARQAEERFQRNNATDAAAPAETRAMASPTSRRGLRM